MVALKMAQRGLAQFTRLAEHSASERSGRHEPRREPDGFECETPGTVAVIFFGRNRPRDPWDVLVRDARVSERAIQ